MLTLLTHILDTCIAKKLVFFLDLKLVPCMCGKLIYWKRTFSQVYFYFKFELLSVQK